MSYRHLQPHRQEGTKGKLPGAYTAARHLNECGRASRFAKYTQILKDSVASKKSAGERMFLIKAKMLSSLLIFSRTISTNPLARLLSIDCWRSIVFLII